MDKIEREHKYLMRDAEASISRLEIIRDDLGKQNAELEAKLADLEEKTNAK